MPANWTPADHAGLYGGDHATEAADNDTYTRPAPQYGSTEELAFNIFDRMDADGSGCLDKPEVTRLVDEVMGKLNLELLPEQHDKLINQSFKSADANSDGRLSRVEFEAAYGQTDESGPSPSAAMIAKRQGTMKDLSLFNVDGKAKSGLFRKFDENQDHRLDVGEAQKFLVSMLGSWGLTSDWVTPAWVREQFKRIDADGDAETVTADEFQARARQPSSRLCEPVTAPRCLSRKVSSSRDLTVSVRAAHRRSARRSKTSSRRSAPQSPATAPRSTRATPRGRGPGLAAQTTTSSSLAGGRRANRRRA